MRDRIAATQVDDTIDMRPPRQRIRNGTGEPLIWRRRWRPWTALTSRRARSSRRISAATAAHEMGISVNTVSFHIKHIYQKLQVHSKTEAVAKALREGLV